MFLSPEIIYHFSHGMISRLLITLCHRDHTSKIKRSRLKLIVRLFSTLADVMATHPPQQPVKPQFWRIRNIKTSERDAAQQWLRSQVKYLVISEGRGYSLAPDSEGTLCATLTSFEQPKPDTRSWHVDKDFIGFTPLCDPEDANVDIIAVTGLGGHALGSFRSMDGKSVWLRDFAPENITQARFITYGYDTGVVASDNRQGVHELARTLLDGLTIFRQRTQSLQRPLVFVCHSLGGVVLKETLVMSSKATEPNHRKLLEVMLMTYGLVFMGVPNLGLRHNQLQTVVRGQPNEAFVRDLLVQSDGEPSQFLSYLTSEFADLDRRRRLPFEIISYYETVSSPTVEVSVPSCALVQVPCGYSNCLDTGCRRWSFYRRRSEGVHGHQDFCRAHRAPRPQHQPSVQRYRSQGSGQI